MFWHYKLCRQKIDNYKYTYTETFKKGKKKKKTLKKAYFNDTIIDIIHFPRYFLTKYSLCKSTGRKGILQVTLLNPRQ